MHYSTNVCNAVFFSFPCQAANSLGNVDAERVLLRIRQKLEGIESGEGEASGVEGQVRRLIQEATDPDRLSRMYVGWAPFV
jgi:serine-protein kinase ATM